MKQPSNFFYIGVIGSAIMASPLWKNPNLLVQSIGEEDDLSLLDPHLDYIFLSTPVEWDQDGYFNVDRLRAQVVRLCELSFHHKIILTSVLPLGIAEELGCHYCPLILFHEKRLFGWNATLAFDEQLLSSFLSIILSTYQCLSVRDAEMKCLIDISQCWINQSFQKEISIFCSKNRILFPFHHSPATLLRKEMTPVLVYIIRQIEDTKLDCPLLYSCLFRHHYIDIPIINRTPSSNNLSSSEINGTML